MGRMNYYAGSDLSDLEEVYARLGNKEATRKIEEDYQKSEEFKKNVRKGDSFGNEEVSRALELGYTADDINRYLKISEERPTGNFAVGGYKRTSEVRGAGEGQARFDTLKDPYWIAVAPPTKAAPEEREAAPPPFAPAPAAPEPAPAPAPVVERPDPYQYGAMARPESQAPASIYGDRASGGSNAEPLLSLPTRTSEAQDAPAGPSHEESTDWRHWLKDEDRAESFSAEDAAKRRQYTALGQPLAGTLWG